MINTYKPEQQSWDRYRAFYTAQNGFVSFSTGETMYTYNKPDPSDRRYYKEHNVTIIGTSDDTKMVYLHPQTGKAIPKAQLTFQGIQYLLVDHESKRAVRLHDWHSLHEKNDRPAHLADARAFTFTGASNPIGASVVVNAPTVITPEHLVWKKTVETIIKLKGNLDTQRSYNYGKKISSSTTKETPYEYVQRLEKDDRFMYHCIGRDGVEFTRDPEPLDFIMVDL